MKKKIKLFPILVLLFIVLVTGSIITFFYNDSKKWKIQITHTAGVNVRVEPNPYAKHYGKAMHNSKFKVREVYNKDKKFVWYKVKLTRKTDAWIASDREHPYVVEYNNPISKELNKKYIDYDAPEVMFLENPYVVDTMNDINYDHINIKDDSKYEAKHVIYKEIKDEETTYWLELIVEDEFGNIKEVTQQVIFKTTPDDNEVKDFEILKAKRKKNE